MKSEVAFMMSFVTWSLLLGAARTQNCTPGHVTEMALMLNKESVLDTRDCQTINATISMTIQYSMLIW